MTQDVSKIKNSDARYYAADFFAHRSINREVYNRIPEDKLDFRMVNTAKRKSDSPRETILHQIYVTRKYLYGITEGVLRFDGNVYKKVTNGATMTKKELLIELDETGKELVDVLKNPDTARKKVTVPWSKHSVSAISSLAGLLSHEILHTGWNLALMDHLSIERFPLMKEMWG